MNSTFSRTICGFGGVCSISSLLSLLTRSASRRRGVSTAATERRLLEIHRRDNRRSVMSRNGDRRHPKQQLDCRRLFTISEDRYTYNLSCADRRTARSAATNLLGRWLRPRPRTQTLLTERNISSLSSSSSSITNKAEASDDTTSTSSSSSSPTTAVSTDIGAVWENRTQGLLDLPVGSFRDETWAEAILILKHWLTSHNVDNLAYIHESEKNTSSSPSSHAGTHVMESNGRTATTATLQAAVESCWRILDRLSNEQKEVMLAPSFHVEQQRPYMLSTTEVFNPVMKLWRHAYKQYVSYQQSRHNDTKSDFSHVMIVTPSAAAQRLMEYETCKLVQPDRASFSMILDATSYDPSNFDNGVLFADSYLEQWTNRFLHGVTDVRPDIVAIGTVVHAWAESDMPEACARAEHWASMFLETTDKTTSFDNNDLSKLYSSVMLAWARIGQPRGAQKWMNSLQKDTKTKPDVTAWSTLLLALANANAKEYPDASARAEQVLNEMEHLHRQGEIEKPNVVSYTHAMEAWHKRSKNNQYAARRALTIFEKMERNGVNPTTVSYNTIISALTRAGDLQRAEELLKEMASSKHDNVAPDARTFTSILAGLSRLGTVKSAEQAESLVSTMRKLGISPTTKTYSSFISCWAHVAGKGGSDTKKNAVERAQAIFDQMKEVDKLEPDVFVYTSLLNVYGKSGRSQRAQQILDEFLAMYQKSRRSELKPTVHTFSSVLSAWSQSNDPDAAEKAHQLLLRMEKEFQVSPNVYCYSAVLSAYAKSKKRGSIDAAKQLFEELKTDAIDVVPNAYCYNAMIQVWANVGRADEAEKLLEEMLSDSDHEKVSPKQQKKSFIKPTAHTFSSVIHAWSKSHDPRAGDRAEKILQKMQNLYQMKVITEPPNSICYTSVISCWAHSASPEGPQRANDWLRAMQATQAKEDDDSSKNSSSRRHGVDNARNRIAYNVVMNAWAHRGDCRRVQLLFDELVALGRSDKRWKPDEYSYRALLKAIRNNSDYPTEEKARRTEQVLMMMSDAHLGTSSFASQNDDDGTKSLT